MNELFNKNYSDYLLMTGQGRRVAAYEERARVAGLLREKYLDCGRKVYLEFLSEHHADTWEEVFGSTAEPAPGENDALVLRLRAFAVSIAGEGYPPIVFGEVSSKYQREFSKIYREMVGKALAFNPVDSVGEDEKDLARIAAEFGVDFIGDHQDTALTPKAEFQRYGYADRLDECRREQARAVGGGKGVRAPAALLKSAASELDRFLTSMAHIHTSLEWGAYEDLVIQARYLFWFNKDLRAEKRLEREFQTVITHRRICKNCGAVFEQQPSDNFQLFCKDRFCVKDRQRQRTAESRARKQALLNAELDMEERKEFREFNAELDPEDMGEWEEWRKLNPELEMGKLMAGWEPWRKLRARARQIR